MGTNTSALSLNQLAKPSVLWLTFFGAGLLQPAPGTWGSVAALAVWWWGLSQLPALTQGVIAVVYSLCKLVGLCEIFAAHRFARRAANCR